MDKAKRVVSMRNSSQVISVIALALVAIALAAFLLPQFRNSNAATQIEPTRTPVPYGALLSNILEIGHLITIRQEFAAVDLEVRDPAPLGCTYTAQHVAKGVVEAGIDLTAIDEDNIQRNLFRYPVKVNVPSPAISSCRIEYFRQYDKKGGGTAKCFGNNWDAMSEIGRHLAMELFVSEALERDILEITEEQVSLVLGSSIRNLIGGQVQIVFEDRLEDPIIPQSCKIKPPANWEPREDGSWRRTRR